MRPALLLRSFALTALATLPLVSSVPVPDARASIEGNEAGFDSGTVSYSTGSSYPPASTSASAVATSTPAAVANNVSLTTELPVSVPTQNSWVEATLDYTEAQRSALDHLTYNFRQDGLDAISALTFANIMEFQESLYEKLNSELNTRFDTVGSKQILIIALIAGGLGGFLLCGLLYALVVSIRCCHNRSRARKQRKLEERNSFTMVSPSSRRSRSLRKGEKHGERFPIDSTPTPVRAPAAMSKFEAHELNDRRPPTPSSSRGAAPAYSGPQTPTPRYTSLTSSQAPRLTIPAIPSSLTSDVLAATGGGPNAKQSRQSTAGRTSISDILAEFDFDVDEDENSNNSSNSNDAKSHHDDTSTSTTLNKFPSVNSFNTHPNTHNGYRLHHHQQQQHHHHPPVPTNESSWTLGTSATTNTFGTHRISEEGSQIGIMTGKDVSAGNGGAPPRGERRDGKFYRKSRIMPM